LKQASYVFLTVILLFGRIDAFSVKVMSAKLEDCKKNASYYADSISVAFENNDLLHASELLVRWENQCGLSEPVFRARLLLNAALKRDSGLNSLPGLLEQAVSFEIRYQLLGGSDEEERNDYYELYPGYFGYVSINSRFDRQTQLLALKLLNKEITDDVVHAFVMLYSGETEWFFHNLKEGNLADTYLLEEYRKRVSYFKQKPELSVGISTGLWIPQGNLNAIGLKPVFGVQAGIKKRSSSLHAVLAIRFGSTRKPISFSMQDTLVTTRNQQGGYAGLEWVQSIYRREKISVGFTFTGGYDVIDMVEDRQDPRRKTFGSWFLQPGLFLEFPLPNQSALGLYPYFALLNHKNSGISALDGNAWFITLRYRLSGNVRKTENLKRLGY
jgi:hypothetical protein